MNYKSQYEQDKFINENIFKSKKNGFFLDIGANDGVLLSNSYFFEKELNWKGICFEPIPDVYNKLIENRSCTCICGCVSEKTGKQRFLHVKGEAEMLSGLLTEFHPSHLNRIDYDVNTSGGKKDYIEVDCYNINDTLKSFNIKDVDYCSIDTEGNEFKILKSINFDEFNILCFSIENNYNDYNISNFMLEKGYNMIKNLGCDEIYLKKEFKIN